MVYGVGIGVKILVEGKGDGAVSGMLVHGDEAPDAGVIVPGAQVIQPAVLVKILARIPVADSGVHPRDFPSTIP